MLPEFIICTPAEPSPSNPVTGLLLPRHPSSAFGSANQNPIELRSVRALVALLKANASSTMSVKTLTPWPCLLVVKSPMYSAAPKFGPAFWIRKTV